MKRILSIIFFASLCLPACAQFVPSSGQSLQVTWTPTSAKLGDYLGYQIDDNIPLVTTISFNATNNLGGFSLAADGAMRAFLFPNLVSIDRNDDQDGNLVIESSTITNLSLPKLQFVGGWITVAQTASLQAVDLHSLVNAGNSNPFHISETVITSLDLRSLVSCQTLQIQNNASLTNIIFSAYIPANGGLDTYNGDALTAASIDGILAIYVNTPGYLSGTIDLSGGANATPDATGLAYIATLTGRGVTVFNN